MKQTPRSIACDWLIFSCSQTRCLAVSGLTSLFHKMSFISILWWQKSWNGERNSVFENSQLKIRRGRRSELVVSCQVVINQFCGLPVIFCGFISHLIGRETINIPEIFSGVHGFSGKTVNLFQYLAYLLTCSDQSRKSSFFFFTRNFNWLTYCAVELFIILEFSAL